MPKEVSPPSTSRTMQSQQDNQIASKSSNSKNTSKLSGLAQYKCDECKRKLKYKSHLEIHRRIHTGERSFQCQDCGERFKRIYHLNRHKLMHTGEKTHSCSTCGKKFARQDKHSRITKRYMKGKENKRLGKNTTEKNNIYLKILSPVFDLCNQRQLTFETLHRHKKRREILRLRAIKL